jgi:hypothetical protein
VIGLTLLLTVGCAPKPATRSIGRPGQTPTARATPSPSGNLSFSLQGNFELTGEINANGDVADDAKTLGAPFVPCVDIAREGARVPAATYFPIPGRSFKASDKNSVAWLNIQPYKGPQKYAKDAFPPTSFLAAEEKLAGIIIDRLGDSPTTYKVADASIIGAEVKQDASGSVSFTDLTSDNGGKISGKITWTCRDS